MLSINVLFEDKIDELIKKIDRADFLPSNLKHLAYDNIPLPIDYEQTTSAPRLVESILRNLDLDKRKTVLEVGTGSGWQTVLMAKLCKHVYSIEINRNILKKAKKNIDQYDPDNITLGHGNGLVGWKKHAPFDRIVISAALNKVPAHFLDQLKPNGFIIAPISRGNRQRLLALNDKGVIKDLGAVKFVEIQNIKREGIRDKIKKFKELRKTEANVPYQLDVGA